MSGVYINGLSLEDFGEYGGEYAGYLIGTGQAISVPDHGRLIDADKLIADAKEELLWVGGEEKYWYWNDGANNVIDLANTAPTVIEADRSE